MVSSVPLHLFDERSRPRDETSCSPYVAVLRREQQGNGVPSLARVLGLTAGHAISNEKHVPDALLMTLE